MSRIVCDYRICLLNMEWQCARQSSYRLFRCTGARSEHCGQQNNIYFTKNHNEDYDIDKLVRWSEKWQMLFNFGKCKCLHTGPGNTGMNYKMGGPILSKTVKEKYLGATLNANMKVSEQCRIAASKGNQVLGMIRRIITYKDKSLIVPLYKAIVRIRRGVRRGGGGKTVPPPVDNLKIPRTFTEYTKWC